MDRQRILIDTSILIDHLRREHKERSAYFGAAQRFDCSVSAITEFEFRVGMTTANRSFVEALLDITPILPFDSACVHAAAGIYRNLKAVNQLIALPDLFIAATAVAYDLPLLTLNLSHFERVGELTLLSTASLQ
jgi:predicted nucleic acid-binding protein